MPSLRFPDDEPDLSAVEADDDPLGIRGNRDEPPPRRTETEDAGDDDDDGFDIDALAERVEADEAARQERATPPATPAYDPNVAQATEQARQFHAAFQRRDAEYKALEKRVNDDEARRVKEQHEALGRDIESARTRLQAAVENGDSAEQARLQAEIAEKAARRETVSQRVADAERRAAAPPPRTEPAPSVEPARQEPQIDRGTADWLNRNRWFRDPAYAQQAAAAQAVEREFYAELVRLNPGQNLTGLFDDPAYWQKLEDRLVTRIPELGNVLNRTRGITGVNDDGGQRTRATRKMPGMARDVSSRGGVNLTSVDIDVIKGLGINNYGKKGVAHYMRQKKALARRERERRG